MQQLFFAALCCEQFVKILYPLEGFQQLIWTHCMNGFEKEELLDQFAMTYAMFEDLNAIK